MEFEKKLTNLKKNLQTLGKVAVAFSGGKDSFFLLKTAVETLGKENVTAFFVRSDLLGKNDDRRVHYFAGQLNFNLKKIFIDVTGEKRIMSNPVDRCYYCKKMIFSTLKREAAKIGIKKVLDGTTFSDLNEYRPGLRALEELNILSPLKDGNIASGEVVDFLTAIPGIEGYFLTSSTCLATRFPYDYPITKNRLETFAEIECFFFDTDIYPIKIRYIEDGIRIETEERHFGKILEIRGKILRFCKKKGLKFITLDIEGLKSGTWDPIIKRNV